MVNKKDVEITKAPEDIINCLAIALRAIHIYDASNKTVISSIEKLIAVVNPLIFSDNILTLELFGDFFYLNSARVRYPMEYLLNFDFICREFKKCGIGGITIDSPLTLHGVQIFLKAFIFSSTADEPFKAFSEYISQLSSITITPVKQIKEDDEIDMRKVVKKTYFNAVSYMKGIVTKLKSGEKISIKKTRRIIETLVDLILEEKDLLVGMTAIKDYDEYTYHHSINVSILSIALGERLGLNKKNLSELGLAAFFHDIGKMNIPSDILNKPTSLNEYEWDIVRKHPLSGVSELLKLRELDNTSLRVAIAAFEHHLNYDLSGYPQVSAYSGLDFYSKIISLADRYDAMTSARVYSRTPMAPDKALSEMMEKKTTYHDPVLFKFFVNMIGIFPIGTLTLLNTKELGLVCEGNSAFPDRPRVLIVMDSNGVRTRGPVVVGLEEKDSSGRYVRSIIKTLDPNKYRINLGEYFM